jgi:hypothetical protein
MKRYAVYDGHSAEADIRWLTPAQVVELRHQGYYVREL